jgi:hypothetical protein
MTDELLAATIGVIGAILGTILGTILGYLLNEQSTTRREDEGGGFSPTRTPSRGSRLNIAGGLSGSSLTAHRRRGVSSLTAPGKWSAQRTAQSRVPLHSKPDTPEVARPLPRGTFPQRRSPPALPLPGVLGVQGPQ